MSRRIYRTHYKYLGQWGGSYHWEAVIPGDSRVVHVCASVEWFWQLPPKAWYRMPLYTTVHPGGAL